VKCISSLVMISMLAIASVAYAGVNVWTTHGPYGGHVNALAIDPHTPSTLYAGTSVGVFQSLNSGVTWSTVRSGAAWWLLVPALVLAWTRRRVRV